MSLSPGQALSRRQAECLQRIAEGWHYSEIAAVMELSRQTVRNHLARAYSNLGARNGPHAIALALRRGIIK